MRIVRERRDEREREERQRETQRETEGESKRGIGRETDIYIAAWGRWGQIGRHEEREW